LIGNDISSYLQPFAFSKLNTVEQILLGIRYGRTPQGDGIHKNFVDRGAALPKDAQRFIQLFKTALQTRALDNEKKGAIPKSGRKKQDEIEREMAQVERSRMPSPAPPPSAPTPAAAPMMMMQQQVQTRSGTIGGLAMPSMSGFGASQPPPPPQAKLKLSVASGGKQMQAPSESFDSFAATVTSSTFNAPREQYAAPATTKEYEERNYYDVTSSNTDAASTSNLPSWYRCLLVLMCLLSFSSSV
jgi:hypothetical protein